MSNIEFRLARAALAFGRAVEDLSLDEADPDAFETLRNVLVSNHGWDNKFFNERNYCRVDAKLERGEVISMLQPLPRQYRNEKNIPLLRALGPGSIVKFEEQLEFGVTRNPIRLLANKIERWSYEKTWQETGVARNARGKCYVLIDQEFPYLRLFDFEAMEERLISASLITYAGSLKVYRIQTDVEETYLPDFLDFVEKRQPRFSSDGLLANFDLLGALMPDAPKPLSLDEKYSVLKSPFHPKNAHQIVKLAILLYTLKTANEANDIRNDTFSENERGSFREWAEIAGKLLTNLTRLGIDVLAINDIGALMQAYSRELSPPIISSKKEPMRYLEDYYFAKELFHIMKQSLVNTGHWNGLESALPDDD